MVVVFGHSMDVFCQINDNNWLWGIEDSVGIVSGNAQGDFFNDSIRPYAKTLNMPFQDCMAAFSDDYGNLQIYSNGFQIKDSTGNIIAGGDSLSEGGLLWDIFYQGNGGYGSAESKGIIMINKPGDPATIYVFHQKSGDSASYVDSEILFTEVLKDSNNTFRVIKKNSLLSPYHPAFQNLAACKHANGRDWWLLFTEGGTNCIVKFLITTDTMFEFEKQCIGDIIRGNDGNNATFSLDGSKFSNSDGISNGTNIFNFDRCSGLLYNHKHINPIAIYNGTQLLDVIWSTNFSPDNRFIYLIRGAMIYQFDLLSQNFPNDIDTIAVQDTFIDTILGTSANPFVFWSSTYGPDGRLYVGPAAWQRFLCTINNPNGKGDSCDFRMRNVILPKVWYYTKPNFPNYRLGRLPGSACDTIYNDIKPLYTQTPWLKVYPNPATDIVRFDYNWVEWDAVGECQLVLADLQGRVVLSQIIPKYSSRHELSIKQLTVGVYTASVQSGVRQLAVCKVIKE